MKRMIKTVMMITLVSLVSFYACKKKKTDEKKEEPLPVLKAETKNIQEDYLNKQCLGCHSKANKDNKFVNLTNIIAVIENKFLVDDDQRPKNIIVHGKPAESTLFLTITKPNQNHNGKFRTNDQINKAMSDWIGGLKAPASLVPPPPVEIPLVDSLAKNVQENIINKKCLGCHSGSTPQAGLDFSNIKIFADEANAKNYVMNKGKVISRGQPEQSLLYTNTLSGRMPLDPSARLNQQEVSLISSWINELTRSSSIVQPNVRTFLQWCNDFSKINPDERATLQKIFVMLQTQDCNLADQKLQRATKIVMGSAGIVDVKIFAAIPQLVELDLSNNFIEDVSSLNVMKNLKVLKLSGNHIIEVKGLAPLTQLQELHINSNRIRSTKDLAPLTNLKLLDAKQNPIYNEQDKACPIADPYRTICKFE